MADFIGNVIKIGNDTLTLEDKNALKKSFGTEYVGNVLVVGEDGNVTTKSVTLLTNPFAGMKYCAVGDSITYGVGASDNSKRWADLLVAKLNLDTASYQNLGVSNTTITVTNDTDNSICNRIIKSNIASDCELITLMGGVNDFHLGRTLGTFEDSLTYFKSNGKWETTNFCGALCAIIDYVHTKRPNAHLIVLTPMHYENEYVENSQGKILLDYVQAIRDICEYFAVYVVDCYRDLPIDAKNAEQKSLYTSNGVVADGIHPSDKGHEAIANMVANRLKFNYIL